MADRQQQKKKHSAQKSMKTAVERAIREFVRTSPLNRLESFGSTPIFEAPLVGFAAGDDPLFTDFKKTVSPDHMTPREVLAIPACEITMGASPHSGDMSVISFVLPIAIETRKSNAREKEGPSLRWNHTRWKGQEFITELSRYLVAWLENKGARAVAPDLCACFKIARLPDGSITSNWSHRHAAYAAGLGTFSLNDGFITPKGIAARFGSIVTDLKLEPSERPYSGHLANCRFYAEGKCGACIRRCPGGALSEKGHDKQKCREVLFEKQKSWLTGAHGSGYIGQYAGCGLCQTGVPCENRIPLGRKDEGVTA